VRTAGQRHAIKRTIQPKSTAGTLIAIDEYQVAAHDHVVAVARHSSRNLTQYTA